MATRRFDRIVISVIAGMVIVTGAASMTNPYGGVTAAPRVIFDGAHAESAHLGRGVRNVAPARRAFAALENDVAATEMRRSAHVAATFERMGYHLEHIRDFGAPVPRVYLGRLPDDLHAVAEVSLKKTVFFKTMLPLILKENERIMADRQRLRRIKAARDLGHRIPARDRLWIAVLAERYKTKDENLKALLQRVDAVPPSLALAQAAEESGWGTSRFAQNANALYGQWTSSSDDGVVPEDRPEGWEHKIKAFDNLAQSVAAYMRNLNTHRAYREFRKHRAGVRGKGGPLDGHALAATLTRYSERGREYIESIRVIIDANSLRPLDDARLRDDEGDRAA